MIECIEFRSMNQKSLVGLAKIKVKKWGLVIKDVKLLKTNDTYWVSLPTKEFEKDGVKKYYPVLELESKEMQQEFLNKILDVVIQKANIGQKKEDSEMDLPW